jgi:HPr kinase/phosphorylase
MEVRGLGIINVAALYGIGAIRPEKRLDLVVSLVSGRNLNDVERIGAQPHHTSILGIQVPLIELPVLPGRDMAQLVEVAALDQKLKALGHNSAVEFSKNLLDQMQAQRLT